MLRLIELGVRKKLRGSTTCWKWMNLERNVDCSVPLDLNEKVIGGLNRVFDV